MTERFARRIPEPTVVRLPLYRRVLVELSSRAVTTVSSAELAAAAGVNAAKVRKDLSHLGTYGTPGTGYDVDFLLGQIRRELGLDSEWRVAIAGMGNLGHALARSQGFSGQGFSVVALLDVDPAKLGEVVAGVQVRHLTELPEVAAETCPSIAVIASPPGAAQDVCDRLVAVGIGAVLNFAPAIVTVPAHVLLRQVDFAVELQVLGFYLAHREAAEPRADMSRPAL
jgi:redox-sensing transcriptional repressor